MNRNFIGFIFVMAMAALWIISAVVSCGGTPSQYYAGQTQTAQVVNEEIQSVTNDDASLLIITNSNNQFYCQEFDSEKQIALDCGRYDKIDLSHQQYVVITLR
jgi:tRNA G37 N-methylase TrmD